MDTAKEKELPGMSRQEEEAYLDETLTVVRKNVEQYGQEVQKMSSDIDEMREHFRSNDVEMLTLLHNTITLRDHMKRAFLRNEKAQQKPYFGRIVFRDETAGKEESLYIGKGGISRDTTHWMVVDWRAPVANVYYENGLGECSYAAPGGSRIRVRLKRKRTYEIEEGKLLDYFDSEVIANDDLLTKYLAKNKQAVLGEIVATIQKEQNEIIRKSPYHNVIVQGVAGSGKTTVAMHRISYILYNYQERFRPDDFYIVGSNRILLNYITGVLPDLDVYGVRQMTMEQLFVRLLYEDWDEEKYKVKESGGNDGRENIKGGRRWFRALETYCDRLEWETIPRETVYLNPRQFVEGMRDGKTGVFDETDGKPAALEDLVRLVDEETVERYIRQNPGVSVQSKINMLNERLINKIKEEFLGKGIKYTDAERKAILKAYRGKYGGRAWKRPIYDLYREFLMRQAAKGHEVSIPEDSFDVYDLAALAYLYKRVKETEVISEAHHVVIDEAQDFGIMAYAVLKFCLKGCTYTVMGDVSQNIHFGYGLNDWEELRRLLLTDAMDSFGILKKSYRNTVEISRFATQILHHGQFAVYPVEPIIRHGKPVEVREERDRKTLLRSAARVCRGWQETGLDTIAVVCRNQKEAARAAQELSEYLEVMESDPEKTVFGSGVMVLPVNLTKGLEFDAVLVLDPDRKDYPVDDGHAKLLYVAATRALHELCVLHTGNLTGLIADPIPEGKRHIILPGADENREKQTSGAQNDGRKRGCKEGEDTSCVKRQIGRGSLEGKRAKLPTGCAAVERGGQEGRPIAGWKERNRPVAGEGMGMLRSTPGVRQQGSFAVEGKGQSVERVSASSKTTSAPTFGDMPDNGKLRPAGHGKIDLAVRWMSKETDGLYLSSRYGVLRISPVDSGIIRITFARGTQLEKKREGRIVVPGADDAWMYRTAGNAVEVLTDDLCLRVDKTGGAITYMTRDRKPLLSERAREPRQMESGTGGMRTWLYLDWTKEETLQGVGSGKGVLSLRKSARYISHGEAKDCLPLLLSDRGYGILMASNCPTICCDIPTYGSYLYTEGDSQMDYYFLLAGAVNKIKFPNYR